MMEQAAGGRKVLVMAAILGLIAAAVVGIYVSRTNTAPTITPVVFARQEIPPRTVIEPAMVERRMSADGPQGAYTNCEDAIGKVAVVRLNRGDAVTRHNVQNIASFGLPYRTPDGMRAVAVALDPIIGVAGFIRPGDNVDVLATFNIDEGTVTKTVLQNVGVLATGTRTAAQTAESGKDARAEPVPNATLSVDIRDAEKLVLAESRGKLRLALRPAGDFLHVWTPGVTGRSLIGAVPPDVPAASPLTVATVQSPSTANKAKWLKVPPYEDILSSMGPGHPLYRAGDPPIPVQVMSPVTVVRGSKATIMRVPANR